MPPSTTRQDSLAIRKSPRLVNKPTSNYHEVRQDKKRRNMKKTWRSNFKASDSRLTKRLNHSKVNVELCPAPARAPSAGDDASQAGTLETDEDRLPKRTEDVEYITIDDAEPEQDDSFIDEVNRDYHRGKQPCQEGGRNNPDDSTIEVITIEDRDSQENEELEEEVLTQLDDSVIEEVITDHHNGGDPAQLSQEDVGITLDDSFMEDANRDYNSNRNTQDNSIDALLNNTITIIDDPIADDFQEENEVIYLTTGLADTQVSSVFPFSNETVDEEICPVCHDTFENIEKERIPRVKLVCRHVLCHNCFVGCMRVKNQCPVCRATVKADDKFIFYEGSLCFASSIPSARSI